MRLFLLPISTRRTLIYCQRLNIRTPDKLSYVDKATTRAAKMWAGWEKQESGWKKKVVDYGNEALKRIPYEEWGLKSIPPLSARRIAEEQSAKEKVEVVFPTTMLPEANILEVLRKLGTERQGLHRKWLIWSIVGMPISAPVALVPVIPNLPFFYLVYRAFSNYKALMGSKHLEFLVDKKLVAPKPSKILDELYSTGDAPFNTVPLENIDQLPNSEGNEQMVLHKSNGKRIAEALEIPELEIELDRAVWQVEKALRNEKELRDEKRDLKDHANSVPGEKKH